jgi:hypothetical protein
VIAPRGSLTITTVATREEGDKHAPPWSPTSRTKNVTADVSGLDFLRCYPKSTPATVT